MKLLVFTRHSWFKRLPGTENDKNENIITQTRDKTINTTQIK